MRRPDDRRRQPDLTEEQEDAMWDDFGKWAEDHKEPTAEELLALLTTGPLSKMKIPVARGRQSAEPSIGERLQQRAEQERRACPMQELKLPELLG